MTKFPRPVRFEARVVKFTTSPPQGVALTAKGEEVQLLGSTFVDANGKSNGERSFPEEGKETGDIVIGKGFRDGKRLLATLPWRIKPVKDKPAR